MAKKNIVICSDGTGNRGGVGNETNVWRIYNAIERHTKRSSEDETKYRQQIAHYDDGVGTDNNRYLKALTGAFGLGFSDNVKAAYKFLVTHHDTGDEIFLFGFSRGAYTSRALAAFINTCGILAYDKNTLDADLDEEIDRLIVRYKNRSEGTEIKSDDAKTGKIKFIGVWDTVSAIGLPFDIGLQDIILKIFPFSFKDRTLGGHEKITARHALAIDDKRRTFHPTLWNEGEKAKSGEPVEHDIEQVWFSGMHSNVGGGYPKQGLSYVALDWMVDEVSCPKGDGSEGLLFEDGFQESVAADANVHAKMYDSRSGAAAYYRYTPRDIAALCEEHGVTTVNIHSSVFARIDSRTESYNPGNLPIDHKLPNDRKLKVLVKPTSDYATRKQKHIELDETKDEWLKEIEPSGKLIDKRILLHLAFTLFNILVATALVQYFIHGPILTSQWQFPYLGGFDTREILPGIVALIILFIIFNIGRLGGNIVRYGGTVCCLAAIAVLGVGMAMPYGFLIGFVPTPTWLVSPLEFLLPDILAEALLFFIYYYCVLVLAAIATIFVLLLLRSCYRKRCEKVFEKACNVLRPEKN